MWSDGSVEKEKDNTGNSGNNCETKIEPRRANRIWTILCARKVAFR